MIVGSSPLTDDLDLAKRLEDAGAPALVLPSLYEEEITCDQMADFFSSETYGDSFPEATSYHCPIRTRLPDRISISNTCAALSRQSAFR